MKYLNKTIEYGLYLLVFLLPMQTRWIIKAGELNGGYFEYGTYSLYATDVLLILLLLLFIIVIASDRRETQVPLSARDKLRNLTDSELNQRLSWLRQISRSDDFVAPSASASWRMAERAPRNDKIAHWFLGGLLLISMVSVFFAASRPLALYKLGWLILGVGLFWLVVSANYDKLKLIYFMLAGVFLQAVLGSWQFLTQSSFAGKWLGLAFHNGADLGASVIEAVGANGIGERWLRAYGGLDHPNMLGGLMAISILLIIYLILVDICHFDPASAGEKSLVLATLIFKRFLPRIKVRGRNDIFRTVRTPLLKGLIIVFTVALFFSFSRSAWLGLIIGLAIMIVLAVADRNLKLQKGLAQIILVMGILLFILFGQYQNLITSRLGGEGRLEEKSISERLASYQESWRLIKNNWAAGVGLGNYTLALSRQMPGQKSFYYQPAHNVFMLVWAEIGIVGLLFFLALLFAVASGNLFCHSGRRAGIQFGRDEQNSGLRVKPAMTGCLKSSRNDKREYAPRDDSKMAILIVLIIIMSLDHWIWSLHFGVLFFWLVLGVIADRKRDEKLFLD